jgi:hypothetical protein
MALLDAFPIFGLSQSLRRVSGSIYTLGKKDLGDSGSLLGCSLLEKATPNTFLNFSASFFSVGWRENQADSDTYPNPHDRCTDCIQEMSVIGENRPVVAFRSLRMDIRGGRVVLRLKSYPFDIFCQMAAQGVENINTDAQQNIIKQRPFSV